MSTDLTKNKTSKIIRQMTANARAHFDIFDRARDIYLAQIARAEADYNERLKRALTVLTGEAEAVAPAAKAPAEAPAAAE
jgi:Mg2+ and Co2+ transporter CorA